MHRCNETLESFNESLYRCNVTLERRNKALHRCNETLESFDEPYLCNVMLVEQERRCSAGTLFCLGILPRAMVFSLRLPKGVPMPLRKTAIAIPDDLLTAVDRAAQSRGESRNRFVTRVLEEAVHARRDAEVTKRLNELFAHDDFSQDQAQTASEWDRVGTDWSGERW